MISIQVGNPNFNIGAPSPTFNSWQESPSSLWFNTSATLDQGGSGGVAFFQSASTSTSGTLSQTLSTNVTPFTTYTLSFTIFDSDQLSSPVPPTKGGRLYAGTDLIPLVSSSTPTPDEKGTQWEFVFESGSLGSTTTEAIKIELYARTSGSFSGHGSESVYFDNVTLTAVPEIKAYALIFGILSIGLVTLNRRSRRDSWE